MKRPKRVRKPKSIYNGYFNCTCGLDEKVLWEVELLNLRGSKRLHSWLTKAIAYIEQEGK